MAMMHVGHVGPRSAAAGGAPRRRQQPLLRAPTSSPLLRTRRAVRAAAFGDGGDPFLDSGDKALSFYSLLGVSPTADRATVKKAYLGAIREAHPDVAGEDANELAAILNEVYATLMDDDARRLYDAVSGFAAGAVNPFDDTSFELSEVFVDEVSCIGCGKCVRACPEAFFVEASRYGRARFVPGADARALEQDIEVAILTCPVDCIHYVSAPQLALLEATLAAMARVDAFVMLRAGRSPGNVFEEANRAWRKRQSAIAAVRRQHQASAGSGADGGGNGGGGGWASWFSAHVEVRGPGEAADGAGAGGPTVEGADARAAARVANLAAAASSAMRRWRAHRASAAPQRALTE